MSTAETGAVTDVRLNDLDWDLLSIMADGKRVTPAYLYNDVEALDDRSADWIRRRIKVLHDNGLIEKVGTSSMYVLTPTGRAALTLEDRAADLSPEEFGEEVHAAADEFRAD